MKKISVGIAIVVILLAGAIFFSVPKVNEAYEIGVILPLTGGLAKAGQDSKAALELAQSDFKDINIILLFEDDAFIPKESLVAFNKILGFSNPVAIIGPLNGSSIESVRPFAVENKLPLITPWGAGNNMGEYVYKNSVEASNEALAIANKADSLGYKRIAIIYLQNDFGLMHLQAFKSAVVNNSGVIVAEEAFAFGATDFRASLAKIKSANPDALYIVNNGAGVGQITKQAIELDLKIQFFGQYATESSDLVQVGGNSLEGLIYSFPINESALTAKQKSFIAKFKEKVGGLPQIAAYNAYDIYEIIANAVKVCKKDKECINNYIGNIKEFDGVGGKFSIQNGKLIREFYFKIIKDGKLVSYE
jgi:branched-chain amino acid transport system substrate-binding protein